MKRIRTVKALCAALFIFILVTFSSACMNTLPADDITHIVTTIFPAYDLAKQVAGDRCAVTMLLPPGTESHTFEPTPADMQKIRSCDLFIYNGGESDTWVDGILASLGRDIPTLRMTGAVETLEEELPEGAFPSNEEDEGEDEYDEHVWTAPMNADAIAKSICEKLAKIDPANSEIYKKNYERLHEELVTLDRDFTDFFGKMQNPVMVFGDRFPLRYFAEAYGVKCYAAFPGCASETEPSAATMAFLINKVRELDIHTVYCIEFSNHSIAEAIAEATGAKVREFHSCHNVSRAELESGITYVSLMRRNLDTLKASELS